MQFPQPDDTTKAEEEKRRRAAEVASRGLLDGRRLRRHKRDVGIGLKTSDEKKKQFDRLRRLTQWSYTQIFEKSLDTFEEWFKANPGAKP